MNGLTTQAVGLCHALQHTQAAQHHVQPLSAWACQHGLPPFCMVTFIISIKRSLLQSLLRHG